MDIIESANKSANNILDTYVYGNPVISSMLSLFLVLYAGLAAPKLPKKIAKLFGNEVFRIIILVCIAYMGSKDSSMSIISAVALVISLQTLTYHEANEVVAATISEEASRIQSKNYQESNDNEKYVFDENEEIPEVNSKPNEYTDTDNEEVEYSFSDEPVSDEHDHEDHSEPEPAPELESNLYSEPVSEPVSEPEPVISAQSIEDEESVNYEEPEVSETQFKPESSAQNNVLPQGNNTVDKADLHAGFHIHPEVNNNSGKIRDNSNRIDELEKLIKPSKPTKPTKPTSAPTTSEFNISPFGGETYAEF